MYAVVLVLTVADKLSTLPCRHTYYMIN